MKFVVVFIGLLFLNFAYSQEEFAETVDTIPDTLTKKVKILEIPPFALLNPDTIPLGEHDELICDSYTALGQPWVYDALHSFNSRRMDKFGGYLNVKINEGLAEIRKKGFNSDLKQLYILLFSYLPNS